MKYVDLVFIFFEKFVSIALMLMVFFLLMLEVATRYLLNSPLSWPEELTRFCFVGMIYLSLSYATHQKAHIRIEIHLKKLPTLLRKVVFTIADVMWVFYNLVIVIEGIKVVESLFQFPYISPVLRIPMAYPYMIIPFGFSLMTFRVVKNVYLRFLDYGSSEG